MKLRLPAVASRWRMKRGQSYGRQPRSCLVLSVWITKEGHGRVRTVGLKRSTMRLRTFLRDYEKVANPTPASRREVGYYGAAT